MSVSFKVQYKKVKKTVKAYKTLEEFIQKACKKFNTHFDFAHYIFQFEDEENEMKTVSNENEYQEYINLFEFDEEEVYELNAQIKEKKETENQKEEENDIIQMLTQITQFLSQIDSRISPMEKAIQTLTEKVDLLIQSKVQKPKVSVPFSTTSIEPITIKGNEPKEEDLSVFSFTLLDVQPKEIDMTEIKMGNRIKLKLESNCNTMIDANKWKLKSIISEDSLFSFDDVYLPGNIKPQSTFELSIKLNPIKLDVLNSIPEKQIELEAQIKHDINKVCSDNLKIMIYFRNNDIIRLNETVNKSNADNVNTLNKEQKLKNTLQERLMIFQGGNQNQFNAFRNVNQMNQQRNRGGTINRINSMNQNNVNSMNSTFEQSNQNFQQSQEQMNFNLINNSQSQENQSYFSQNSQNYYSNPNLQNVNSLEYNNGNILNNQNENNQQQFDKLVNEGAPSIINNYNFASSPSNNFRNSSPSTIQNFQPQIQNLQPQIQNMQPQIQNMQPPIQNVQPQIQNVQPPIKNVQNVQLPNNKSELIQKPPEPEQKNTQKLSDDEINKIMTELDDEYQVTEKWEESDIKGAIIKYNGNKEDIINYLYNL